MPSHNGHCNHRAPGGFSPADHLFSANQKLLHPLVTRAPIPCLAFEMLQTCTRCRSRRIKVQDYALLGRDHANTWPSAILGFRRARIVQRTMCSALFTMRLYRSISLEAMFSHSTRELQN